LYAIQHFILHTKKCLIRFSLIVYLHKIEMIQ